MLNDIMEIYIKNANVKRGAKKNMDSIESKLINEIKEAFPNNNLINYEFTNDDVIGLIFEKNLTVDDIIILSDIIISRYLILRLKELNNMARWKKKRKFIENYDSNYIIEGNNIHKSFSRMTDEELVETFNEYKKIKGVQPQALRNKLALYDYLFKHDKLHLIE